MPTTYPKSSVSEVTGLLVLLDAHKGSDDIARLADDLDLEIDEILPSIDFAEALDMVTVSDGRATLTDTGRAFLKGSIRGRKSIVREQLKRTTLFRTLVRALEGAPEGVLHEDDLTRLIEFTTTPSEEKIQNIVNWGRYAELFRYDGDTRVIAPMRRSPPRTPPGDGSHGSTTASPTAAASGSPARSPRSPPQTAPVAPAVA